MLLVTNNRWLQCVFLNYMSLFLDDFLVSVIIISAAQQIYRQMELIQMNMYHLILS